MNQLLAITGYRTSGKSTIGNILEEHHGFIRTKFAGPLKDMLRVIGLTDCHLEGDLKNFPSPLLQGKTPVQAMQTLGTEWGRELIGRKFWSTLWTTETRDFLRQGIPVFVDDLRFPDTEVEAIRELGGKILRVYRDGAVRGDHPSEIELDEIQPDYVIHNNGSLLELRLELEQCLKL